MAVRRCDTAHILIRFLGTSREILIPQVHMLTRLSERVLWTSKGYFVKKSCLIFQRAPDPHGIYQVAQYILKKIKYIQDGLI